MTQISDEINQIEQTMINDAAKIFDIVFGYATSENGITRLNEEIQKYIVNADNILTKVNDKLYREYVRELRRQRELGNFIEKICEQYKKNEELQVLKNNVINAIEKIMRLRSNEGDERNSLKVDEQKKSNYDEQTFLSDQPTFNQACGAALVFLGAITALVTGIKK